MSYVHGSADLDNLIAIHVEKKAGKKIEKEPKDYYYTNVGNLSKQIARSIYLRLFGFTSSVYLVLSSLCM